MQLLDRYSLQCFGREKALMGHEKVCLKINGNQSVKFIDVSISFKKHFKQLAVSFKIYANFE